MLASFEDCRQLLADNPALGRPCDEIRPGLRRMEQGKHVVFYREEQGGVLISPILHQRRLPEHQAIDDDEDDTPSSA
jgi:toxin ParE1/3/4